MTICKNGPLLVDKKAKEPKDVRQIDGRNKDEKGILIKQNSPGGESYNG
jgi:hypothetical protein